MMNRLKGAMLAVLCLGSSAVMAAGVGDFALLTCNNIANHNVVSFTTSYPSAAEPSKGCAEVLKTLEKVESVYILEANTVNNYVVYTLRYQDMGAQ